MKYFLWYVLAVLIISIINIIANAKRWISNSNWNKMQDLRMQVLEFMILYPDRSWFGVELMKALNVSSGRLYPVLAMLERQGYLIGDIEVETNRRRYHLRSSRNDG